jgi:hypothetical protein
VATTVTVDSANLLPFLISVSGWVGYEFDPTDWTAVRTGLVKPGIDQEDEVSFDYTLYGQSRADLALTWSPEPNWVGVAMSADREVELRAEGAAAALQEQLDLRTRADPSHEPTTWDPLPPYVR